MQSPEELMFKAYESDLKWGSRHKKEDAVHGLARVGSVPDDLAKLVVEKFEFGDVSEPAFLNLCRSSEARPLWEKLRGLLHDWKSRRLGGTKAGSPLQFIRDMPLAFMQETDSDLRREIESSLIEQIVDDNGLIFSRCEAARLLANWGTHRAIEPLQYVQRNCADKPKTPIDISNINEVLARKELHAVWTACQEALESLHNKFGA
jgi:hypothetical protein